MVHFDLLKKNRKNYKIKDDLIEREITNKTAKENNVLRICNALHQSSVKEKVVYQTVIRNDPENRGGSKNTHKQLNDIGILIHYIPYTCMLAFRYFIHFIIELFTSII